MSETMERHFKALELDKILHLLAEETSCDAAAELAQFAPLHVPVPGETPSDGNGRGPYHDGALWCAVLWRP